VRNGGSPAESNVATEDYQSSMKAFDSYVNGEEFQQPKTQSQELRARKAQLEIAARPRPRTGKLVESAVGLEPLDGLAAQPGALPACEDTRRAAD